MPLKWVLTSKYKNHYWILKALDVSLENAVQFLDTGPVWKLQHNVSWLSHRKNGEQNENQNCVNIYEAAVVVNLVQALIKVSVHCSLLEKWCTFFKKPPRFMNPIII
ncbi:hypothetical protein NQ314_004982 [Rhamnusium bicolor]|uniref:Uncharacterized protein n=1 Tax=Rhamnusium bicolor TaxID=1586634 RepID=A0AAV8ZKX1_9CUCU|nr:hypothetical protein NQ314_004982 [Rhamnusium bicolor]